MRRCPAARTRGNVGERKPRAPSGGASGTRSDSRSLVTCLIPLSAWWLDVSLPQAFRYDAVPIVFFPIFTFACNGSFDSVFGLPDAVTRKAEPVA